MEAGFLDFWRGSGGLYPPDAEKKMSKRFEYLCSFENLYNAFVRARRGKRSQEVVARFERRLKAELFQMQEELRSRAYHPEPYRPQCYKPVSLNVKFCEHYRYDFPG